MEDLLRKVESKMWLSYFTCPVCGRKDRIEGWGIRGG